MVFSIFANGKPIGRSALESGDPPMGVAFGRFIPEAGFASLLDAAPAPDDGPIRRWGGLAVRSPAGVELECVDAILERYDHGEGVDMEITVYGVAYPLYADLFPDICLRYETAFRDVR